MSKNIHNYAEMHLNDFLDYLAIPSVSAENKGIDEASDWLVKTFEQLGAKKSEKWEKEGQNPFVYAEFEGKSAKTVLFYNHYDVQPAQPLDEWKTEPFNPTFVEGKLVARGASDDKGELMARLVMVKWFQENGGLPVNLKFFVEGEEEIGSLHVDEAVREHAKELKADACIWEGGGKNSVGRFEVISGMKGIVSFDVEAVTADVDMHSSLACFAPNAAWRLVQGLATLKDKNGRITVDGFYDDVDDLTDLEKKAVAQMDFDEEKVKETFGLKRDFITDKPAYAFVNEPTMTINGLTSGYEGEGVKTVLPKYAKAKLDCRLVPGQDPEKMVKLVEAHLKKNGFADLKVTFNLGENAFRSDSDHAFVKLAMATAKKVYGDRQVKYVPNAAGGGPIECFGNVLKLPIVLVGVHNAASGAHAPNEHILVSDFSQGVEYLTELLQNF
ncbi:M20/M25/M40 family metallo-hydrolase [Liquorilactobacillus mali]|nr:M20/M25/M40 family metallo-hydrolase [Liquorilactobacillus mali]EJF00555.1 acetylornithine deacetylase/succinyl-diaminopimelate desuccinylase-like protein [Liquorilactobacillus mali KCTC 3596 = DSM 20444]QFQ74042.1 M20/M25/M40 family metallo-hydrolase [Liquorilactobacillus mali]